MIVASGVGPEYRPSGDCSTGTYEKVGVSNGSDPNRPVNYPTGNSADADRIEAQLAKWAGNCRTGKRRRPWPGYVYFPVAQKKSKGALELQYASTRIRSANLMLPAACEVNSPTLRPE